MTRFYDLSVGKFDQFKRLLADEAGMTAEEAEAILARPTLAKTMVDALRTAMGQLTSDLWTPVSEYRERLLARATERNWPLVPRDWDTLRVLEGVDHAGALKPVSVEVWLGNLQTTYEELWLWVVDEVTKLDLDYGSWRWDEAHHAQKLSGPDNLRFLPGAETTGEPKVTPMGLDLETHWNRLNGIRPLDVRTIESAAGLELFTLLALNAHMIPRMGGVMPQFWVPRLQVTVPGREPWGRMSVLGWDLFIFEVHLSARCEDDRYSSFAVPVRQEL